MHYYLLIIFIFYTIAIARIWFLFGEIRNMDRLLNDISTHYPATSSEDEKWAKLLIKEE